MSRKRGDRNFGNYVGYQAFSSDMPVKRINQTNWYLKFEHNIPAFFINAENIFRQMSSACFFTTAKGSTLYDFSGWQKQCEEYFNLTMEEIICQTDIEQMKSLPSTQLSDKTLNI